MNAKFRSKIEKHSFARRPRRRRRICVRSLFSYTGQRFFPESLKRGKGRATKYQEINLHYALPWIFPDCNKRSFNDINPLTPRGFCQKRSFGAFWSYSGWIQAQSAPI